MSKTRPPGFCDRPAANMIKSGRPNAPEVKRAEAKECLFKDPRDCMIHCVTAAAKSWGVAASRSLN